MIDYVKTQKPARVLLVTECSMADNVSAQYPDLEFVQPCNFCPHMNRITLPKIRHALETMTHEVIIDPAIAERAREALDSNVRSLLRTIAGADLSALTAQQVYQAAQDGDELAREVVRDTARYLGAGVANLLNLFNPDVVVLAGGVTEAGELLLAPLRAEARRRAFRPAVDAARIVPGALGGRAGVVGAVAAFIAEHPVPA
jgi:hypothetical protein